VAAVKNVDPQLLGQRGGPVRAFAGDKRIHPLSRGHRQAVAGAAGDNADFFAHAGSALDEYGITSEDGF